MNFQKAKAIIILFGFVTIVAFVTFILTDTYYKPRLKAELKSSMDTEQNAQSIIVATREIPMGSPITADNIATVSVPFANVSDKVCRGSDYQSIIGMIASVSIYKNQQIIKDNLASDIKLTPEEIEALKTVKQRAFDPSYRYITVDIPKYNFVNERIGINSLVDILVDEGQGKYDVVLAKVAILDKVPINSSNSQDSSRNTGAGQIERPLPTPLLLRQDAQGVFGVASGVPSNLSTAQQLLINGNPSLTRSDDYRITIMVTEKEQKRLFEASTYGKFMLREYVLPSQPKSNVTFTSVFEKKVIGDGTEGLPKPVKPVTTNPATNPAQKGTAAQPSQTKPAAATNAGSTIANPMGIVP